MDQIRVGVHEDSFFPVRIVQVLIPISEEFLRIFWGNERQPDLNELEVQIRRVVNDWLEGNSNERRSRKLEILEREYLRGTISPSEFFD